jgi:hypothetical protein
MQDTDEWPDLLIVFDPRSNAGTQLHLDTARRRLGDSLACILATMVADSQRGVVVHFWNDYSEKQFVAHFDHGLIGASMEEFSKRSMPLTHFLPDCRCGNGNEPKFGDELPQMRKWFVKIPGITYINTDSHVVVEARSPEEARRRVIDEWDENWATEAFETQTRYMDMQFGDIDLDPSEIDVDEIEEA